MSWDIFVQDFPPDACRLEDIPPTFRAQPLGLRSVVIARIKEVVPSVDFSDPAWGIVEGPDFSIEINLGKDENLDSFAFHVRGSDTAAGVVCDILQHLKLRAVDCGTGEFLQPQTATEGLRRWRKYRDQVCGPNKLF